MTYEGNIKDEIDEREERANLRMTAKGAHEDGLNELQIDCARGKIDGQS